MKVLFPEPVRPITAMKISLPRALCPSLKTEEWTRMGADVEDKTSFLVGMLESSKTREPIVGSVQCGMVRPKTRKGGTRRTADDV